MYYIIMYMHILYCSTHICAFTASRSGLIMAVCGMEKLFVVTACFIGT